MKNYTLEQIVAELKRDGKVTVVGFGTFKVTDVAERKGRNPRTGDIITIPAHKAVKFKASKNIIA